jgi:hypothetical protein
MDEKCSEENSSPSQEEVHQAMQTRITRAFLAVGSAQGGWWSALEKTWSIIGDASRFYHTALWVGTDRPVGFLLHYGAYYPRTDNESRLFFEGDGATFRPMTIAQFERAYASGDLRELRVRNPMPLGELWQKVSEDGPWTVKAYGWAAHNCQHFTAKVKDVLDLGIRAEEIGDPIGIPEVLKAFRHAH